MYSLRMFVRSLRSATPSAHIVAAATLVVWLVKAGLLDTIPAASPAVAGLGHVVDGLLSAIIAGYVFYIIFAVYPGYQQWVIIAPSILARVRSVVGDSMAIIDKVEAASNLGIPFKTARKVDVENAFRATAASLHPAGMTPPISWPAFFVYRYERSEKAIEEIFEQGRFLDAKLIALLTEIRNAPFYRMSVATGPGPISNPDLSAWAPGFHELLRVERELSKWHDANLVPGVIRFRPMIRD